MILPDLQTAPFLQKTPVHVQYVMFKEFKNNKNAADASKKISRVHG